MKHLRGFLGLTGYYRRFIKHYAIISKPLTQLLKKQSFKRLKTAMIEAHVLSLPNFQKEFVVKTDASGTGIGVVLQQDGHPIAYLSKALSSKHQSYFMRKNFLQ